MRFQVVQTVNKVSKLDSRITLPQAAFAGGRQRTSSVCVSANNMRNSCSRTHDLFPCICFKWLAVLTKTSSWTGSFRLPIPSNKPEISCDDFMCKFMYKSGAFLCIGTAHIALRTPIYWRLWEGQSALDVLGSTESPPGCNPSLFPQRHQQLQHGMR